MPSNLFMPMREQRILNTPALEIRAAVDGKGSEIVGYAAVFNVPSVVLADWGGKFREYIAPEAFKKTLQEDADVRALVNHNPDYVLGRTKSKTLRLREDNHGLRMEIQTPETRWAQDLLTTMQRGDIDGSSIGFRAIKDRWGVGKLDDGEEIDERWVLEAQLFDVSVVTFPAYPQTESQVRSLFTAAGLDFDALARVLRRTQRTGAQGPLSTADRDVVRAAIAHLQSFIPDDSGIVTPTPTDHVTQAAANASQPALHPLEWYKAQLTRIGA
jgi:HK97 family phage prohead protease